jgi:hypothetical protein
MATVKITDEIYGQVIHKVKDAHGPRIIQINAQISKAISFTDIVEAYIEANGGFELYKSCYTWLEPTDSIYVRTINESSNSSYYSYINDAGLPSKLIKCEYNERPYIPRIPAELTLPTLQPKIDALNALIVKRNMIDQEINTTEQALRAIFRNYRTINQALKNHPELENILPDWVKQKLVQVVTRSSTNIPEKINVNLDGLKVVTVLNALNGAK